MIIKVISATGNCSAFEKVGSTWISHDGLESKARSLRGLKQVDPNSPDTVLLVDELMIDPILPTSLESIKRDYRRVVIHWSHPKTRVHP